MPPVMHFNDLLNYDSDYEPRMKGSGICADPDLTLREKATSLMQKVTNAAAEFLNFVKMQSKVINTCF